jgi:hypothetical protein
MPDIAGDRSTTSTVSVGSVVTSSIEAASDHDWFRIDLVAGQAVTFSLNGSGTTPLGDPYLRLRDSIGTILAQNDDGGPGLNSLLSFTATTTGTYYIDVADYSTGIGTYSLQVSPFTPPPVATITQFAAQLTNGYWDGSSHHFNVTQGGALTVNLVGLTVDGQNLARLALQQWSAVIGVNFVEVSSGGQISFDDNQEGAFSSAQWSGGITSSAIVNVSTKWLADYGTTINSYGYQTYLHEIGHALGLGHAGNYNTTADYPVDALFLNDAWPMSVMSYFSVDENSFFSNQGFTRSFLGTPMVVDIAAMSVLYGLSNSTRATNTVYGFNSNAGDVYNATLYPTIAYTVFDSGGIDTLDYSGFSANQVIDLTPGQFSNIGGRTGNVTIAIGTVIENAIGGSGTDTIRGNDAANVLTGNGGADTLIGGAGADSFSDTMAAHNGDIIVDFSRDDKIVFSDAIAASFTYSLTGSTLTYSGGSMTLTGFTGTLSTHVLNGGGGVALTLNTGPFQPLAYGASYPDLIKAFGHDAEALTGHYNLFGFTEGRTVTFNALAYGASYPDLIRAFGHDADALTRHYIDYGFAEGRSTTFNALAYGASYPDLIRAFGHDADALTRHYLDYGFAEGRGIIFNALAYGAGYPDLRAAFGTNADALTRHYIDYGFAEGRTVLNTTTHAQAVGPTESDKPTQTGIDAGVMDGSHMQSGGEFLQFSTGEIDHANQPARLGAIHADMFELSQLFAVVDVIGSQHSVVHADGALFAQQGIAPISANGLDLDFSLQAAELRVEIDHQTVPHWIF